ncbi:TrmH family RNA methyltransferase [Carboxydothermus pertinax]|uniref:RNA methyltransferase TrmH n=1 Tax=Carboxydothermus pertinax TaxID=870242 RepID=A0A1L8CUL3_9THEO|nr:RNA methyltransferase [Carboxydothermus pertinax]GAV22645.1 RNA methyltransferase TrmH [Carboxydothermus pertinax]
MIKKITSKENPFYKQLRKLYHEGAYRRKTGLLVVEGEKLVFEIINGDWTVEQLVVSESYWKKNVIFKKYKKYNNIIILPDSLFNGVSDLITPEGIIAVVEAKSLTFPWEQDGAFLILDGLQDPGNAGNLLRAALGFGLKGAILLPPAVDVYNPKVIRASAGASLKLPVLRMEANKLIEIFHKTKFPLLLAEAEGGMEVFNYKFPTKFFLAIGSEGRGISATLEGLPHQKIFIPMPGAIESLNAALAGGIIMYEWAKNRVNL